MNKILALFLILTTVSSTFGQDEIYIGTKGMVAFTSDAPLELIEASSDQLSGIINFTDRSFLFEIPMNTFEGFNSKLQQTHFNENYIESHKFPKATFEGKIIEVIDYTKPGSYEIRGKGAFNVHGMKDNRIIKCRLVVKENRMNISSDFTVYLEDHDISIPSVVNQKIAEEISVSIEIDLKPKK